MVCTGKYEAHLQTEYMKLRLHDAICVNDSFVFMQDHCLNLKAIRYESTNFNRDVADRFHRVILASTDLHTIRFHEMQTKIDGAPVK